MLDRIDEWTIDFHFNWRWRRRHKRAPCHHRHCGGGRCFSSFFVHRDKRLMKDLRDVEVILRRPRRDLVEIRAALRNIECSFHPKRFELFCQSNRRRLELELWQMKIDVARLEFCATSQHLAAELGFDRAQTIYLSGKKDEQLQIVADIRKTYDRVSIAFRVTESLVRLSHCRNINRSSTANVEWLRLCCVLGKFTGQWGFQIKRVRQDEPGCLTQRSLGNQIANPVACLVCDPFVNVLRSCPGISNEIERLKCRAVIVR